MEISMKMNLIYASILLITLYINQSKACTMETINEIASKINPYNEDEVSTTLQSTLDVIQLCDENLFYAGTAIGQKFNPYYDTASLTMSRVISNQASAMDSEFSKGVALGIIAKVNLYYDTTIYFLNAIISLGKTNPSSAKELAIELLKKSNSYYTTTNNQLLQAVDILKSYAPVNHKNPGSQIWSFKSDNKTCRELRGPWRGAYYVCPQYYASVVDRKGNRITLTCNSEEYGIDLRARPSRELWNQIQNASIDGLNFGTNNINQWLGIPYLVTEDYTLLAESTLSEELLDGLRNDKFLELIFRLNSGEKELSMLFSLAGSNQAIKKLLEHCQ